MNDRMFNLLQAIVILGGMVWFSATQVADSKHFKQELLEIKGNQNKKGEKLESLESLLRDKSVDIILIKRDVDSLNYRVEKLER